ncbi:MAG: T9SS type A sorting domain-containing protein [candidate division WOR-3 bacterium]|nr:MAG: T9SS type A sorting domain-containing protein [candidate division WOR-3 bacterium]
MGVGTMYPFYRHRVTERLAVPTPLVIDLACTYDSITNNGTVDAIVNNTSVSPATGTIHFVIIENQIPYNWGGLTTVETVQRDMLPDASGEDVTIPASDTIIRSRNFTLDADWNELNCKIVVFIQATDRTIYQGAEIALIEQPQMEYYGMSLTEISGNGNGIIEPGESMEINASGKNMGTGVYTGSVGIQCADPYLTITGVTPLTVAIGPGDVDTVLNLAFDVGQSCPDPHLTEFRLIFDTADTATVPLMITTRPGFSDDMEFGEGEWTHYGTGDFWHITEHKSNSPTHSWYCGLEGSWQYSNQNDASLVTPYFVVTPDSSLYFYHQYSFEPDYDFAYVEVDNGSGWWKTLDEFNGTQSSWTLASYTLNDYNGKTIKIRFRFVSDNYTVLEGWYIDDILVYVGVEEQTSHRTNQIPVLRVYPNPFGRKTDIRYQIPDNGNASLKIYDVTGRLVKTFSVPHSYSLVPSVISWDGTDDRGMSVAAGVYIVKLEAGITELMQKVILLK